MRRRLGLAAVLACALVGPGVAPAVQAQGTPVKIALIEDKTGPLEAYAKQIVTGFRMGLEYATKGSDTVAGRKIEIIEKDSQFKPDLGRTLLEQAYGDDNVDLAIGGTSSAVALAMLPVAADYKKLLIVDGAVADSITGEKWNRYIFRVDRNSSMDAISNALSIGKPGVVIATLAQDYAFGRDGIAAFKAALAPTGAKLVHEEYAPTTTTDFTAPMQRILDAMAMQSGEKILFVLWAGADPISKLAAMDPQRAGVKLATGGGILPSLKAYKNIPALDGMQGATYYYYENSKEPDQRLAGDRAPEALQWRAARFLHRQRHGERPRAGGRAGEDARGNRCRDADQGHGGHVLRQPQGARAVPRTGPPGAAIDVRLRAEDGRRPTLGGADADPGVQDRGHEHPGAEQAVIPPPILQTRDLTIRFGGQLAVNAVSCAFHAGTLTAIVGPERRRQDHIFQPDLRPAARHRG